MQDTFESDMDQTRAKRLRILLRGGQISQNEHSKARSSNFDHGLSFGQHAPSANNVSEKPFSAQLGDQGGGSKTRQQTTPVGTNLSYSRGPIQSRDEGVN